MIKISLIIPVYNVEKYLEKCLNSCIMQDISHDDYEIIVVNDGSQDNSLNISNRFVGKFQNLKIFTQNNHGLSAARNKGLSLAKGEYVWFIDSDDWIQDNCLSKIISKCFNEKLDALSISSANIINGKAFKRFEYSDFGILMGRDVMKNVGFQVCVPFTIYRRKFLNDNSLQFYNGIIHEDSEFTPRAYYLAEKVSSLNNILYFVNFNPTSITRSFNPKKCFDLINVCISLNEFSKLILPEYKYIFSNLISTCLNNSLYNSLKINTTEKEKLIIRINESKYLFKHLIKSKVLKYNFEGVFFILFPNKIIQIYKFLQKFNKGQNF